MAAEITDTHVFSRVIIPPKFSSGSSSFSLHLLALFHRFNLVKTSSVWRQMMMDLKCFSSSRRTEVLSLSIIHSDIETATQGRTFSHLKSLTNLHVALSVLISEDRGSFDPRGFSPIHNNSYLTTFDTSSFWDHTLLKCLFPGISPRLLEIIHR